MITMISSTSNERDARLSVSQSTRALECLDVADLVDDLIGFELISSTRVNKDCQVGFKVKH